MYRPALLIILALTLFACADSPGVGVGNTSEALEPTGPIPVEPDGGIGDGAGQPGSDGPAQPTASTTFGVSTETDSSPVAPYAYCLPFDGGPVLCADGLIDPEVDLSATAQLVVTFDVGELSAHSSAQLDDDNRTPEQAPLPLVMENPGIWLLDITGLASGTHTIWLSWNNNAGLDAQAVFDVTVQA